MIIKKNQRKTFQQPIKTHAVICDDHKKTIKTIFLEDGLPLHEPEKKTSAAD